MSRRRNLLALTVIAALAATPALATASRPWQPNPFEHRLSNDPLHEFGEPSIAINPVDPKNMIVIYLRNNDAMVPTAAQGRPFVPDQRDATQQIQGCDYAVTFDGGKTWTRRQLPANNVNTDPVQNNCSDSIVVFDQHGIAHVMAAAYANFAFAGDDEYRFISSRDGGRSWSKPSVVAPTMLGEGSHPNTYDGVRTYDDRPWLTVDPQTSALYIDGTQVRADGQGTNSVYLTASTDGGTTWSDPIVVPTTTLGSAPLGAAYGILGLTVRPPSGEAGCACLDFLTSTDNGKTLHRIHTKIPDAAGPQTVADPTRRAHFVVMTNPGDGYLYIYRTDDAGHTFSGPTRVGVQGLSVVKPWIGFAPNGTLGVGWRGTRADGSYAFFAASSSDGGRTFVHQLQLSKQFSPAAPPYYVAGDDTSTIALSDDRLLAAWGDWRGRGLEHIAWGGYSLP